MASTNIIVGHTSTVPPSPQNYSLPILPNEIYLGFQTNICKMLRMTSGSLKVG